METIKDKIRKLKLFRMGDSYLSSDKLFKYLIPCVSREKPNHIYFLQDNIPVILYDKEYSYFWCHDELIWMKMCEYSSSLYKFVYRRNMVIFFMLSYFNITVRENGVFPSSEIVTTSWLELKFKPIELG